MDGKMASFSPSQSSEMESQLEKREFLNKNETSANGKKTKVVFFDKMLHKFVNIMGKLIYANRVVRSSTKKTWKICSQIWHLGYNALQGRSQEFSIHKSTLIL